MIKDYTKYYTPKDVAAPLVKLMELSDDSAVIDICCGSGNLLNAAKERNHTINCIGVDINDISLKNITTCKKDGRSFALDHEAEYDYALANPPFGYSNDKVYTDRLFSDKYSSIHSSRTEVEMLIANLHILKDTGTLLIILPTTIIEGSSTVNIRKTLATNHYISAIIDLPLNAFSPEKIKCSALIIKKKPSDKSSTTVYKMTSDFQVNELFELQHDCMSSGNWTGETINTNFDFIIQQGGIPTNLFCKDGIEVLHTSRKSALWKPKIEHAGLPPQIATIMAESGDIIISRIGSSAGQKCVYQSKKIYISDCLLIIKAPSDAVRERIMSLDLTQLVAGLSTPHVTARKIYGLYYSTFQNMI